MCIILAVSYVNSLAVDTQTGEWFFSQSNSVRIVGKTIKDSREIVKLPSAIYGIAVDPVLR